MLLTETGRELKLFTPEEATGLVPSLQLTFAALSQMRGDLERTLRALGGDEPLQLAAVLRGEVAPPSGAEDEVEHLQAVLADLGTAVESLADRGVLVTDLDPGVCVFPAMLDDRLVFLSWQFGEPEVSWFHEPDEGIEERQRWPGAAPLLQ